MSTRYRQNFLSGLVTVTSTGSVTITGTGFPNNLIPSGQYMAITLNPGYYGGPSAGEIIYVGYGTTSTVAQVLQRGAEGSIPVTGTNIPWVASVTPTDFDVSNLTATGTLTASGGITSSVVNVNILTANNYVYATSVQSSDFVVLPGNPGLYLSNGATISGIPRGRMYSAASGTVISGYTSPTLGYNTVSTVITGTGGFTQNGVTFANNRLGVPVAGYYQINASVGFTISGGTTPSFPAGVYGAQIEAWTSVSGSALGTYSIGTSYIPASGTAGVSAGTITLSDIFYLPAGGAVSLLAYNPVTTNSVTVGSGNQNATYLSLTYIGS